jgi:chloramphenicol 3-O phosphotransferase
MTERANQNPLIVLNGASSCGKTSLCRELQRLLPEPYMGLEEDAIVFGTFDRRFSNWSIGDEFFTRTMLGYYRSLAAFLSAGHCAIADTGFYTKELLALFAREVQGLNVWMVGVHCSVPELERREKVRGDRPVGLAKAQSQTIHAHAIYDLEVDTSATSLAECAQAIKELLETNPTQRAIERLQAG